MFISTVDRFPRCRCCRWSYSAARAGRVAQRFCDRKKTRSVRAQGIAVKRCEEDQSVIIHLHSALYSFIIFTSLVTIFTFVAVLYHLCHLRHLYIYVYILFIYIYIFPATTTTTTIISIILFHVFHILPGNGIFQATSPRDRTTISRCEWENANHGEPCGEKPPSQWVSSPNSLLGFFENPLNFYKKYNELGCWFDCFGLAFYFD